MRSIFFSLLVLFSLSAQGQDHAIYEESRIDWLRQKILVGGLEPAQFQSTYFIKALSESFDNGEIDLQTLELYILEHDQYASYEDQVFLAWSFKTELPNHWVNYELMLPYYTGTDVRLLNIINPLVQDMTLDRTEMARDLIKDQPAFGQLRLYMFCRNDRQYPCLFVARKPDGQLLKVNNKIWSQPSLGYSRHKRIYSQVNGNTPSGVFKINGVMPVANKQKAYGKYRRLILEFIAKSPNEASMRALLPNSSQPAQWWKENVVARNNGRNAFRIHGTGNRAPQGAPYYPFFGTSGCVAQRENTYDSVTYTDQRKLLDSLMRAMDIEPIYSNEPKIKGYLYVINLNSKKEAVTLEEVQALLD